MIATVRISMSLGPFVIWSVVAFVLGALAGASGAGLFRGKP